MNEKDPIEEKLLTDSKNENLKPEETRQDNNINTSDSAIIKLPITTKDLIYTRLPLKYLEIEN